MLAHYATEQAVGQQSREPLWSRVEATRCLHQLVQVARQERRSGSSFERPVKFHVLHDGLEQRRERELLA